MPIIIGLFIAFLVFPTLVILLIVGVVLSCVIDATVGEYARKKIRIKCSDYLDEPRKKRTQLIRKGANYISKVENTSYSFIVDYGTPILDEERHGLGILYKKLPKDIIGIFSKETVKNFYCKEALEEEWGLSGLDYKATYEKELCYVFRKKTVNMDGINHMLMNHLTITMKMEKCIRCDFHHSPPYRDE